jgi:hypothetical protein
MKEPSKQTNQTNEIDATLSGTWPYGNFSISSGIGFQMCCVNDEILVKVHWHA